MSKSDTKQELNKIGVVGMGVMGAALAENFASKKMSISVYGRHAEKVDPVVRRVRDKDLQMDGFTEIQGFVESLEMPRKIILMVPAGKSVDEMIEKLLIFLDPEDCIVDCGNSFWKDTIVREDYLQTKHIKFVGCGVSGGEEGALNGPSIMPGGDAETVASLLEIFEPIAAKDFSGNPCVANIGSSAAGHFVKMVHNGIEYAMMQGIAEVYDALQKEKYSNDQLTQFFQSANTGRTHSYLLDITVNILQSKDGENFLVDMVSDVAKAKGTGGWTVQSAMELGVFTPTISAAVFARIGSARNQFFSAEKILKVDYDKEGLPYPDMDFKEQSLKVVLEAIFFVSYLQGLDLITHASDEFGWGIDLKEVLRIWQGGCIIRSQMLADLFDTMNGVLDLRDFAWNIWYMCGCNSTVIQPVINSVLTYIQTVTAEKLPSNLIQAQRDYFGAHTYKRIDKEGDFTGGWVTD